MPTRWVPLDEAVAAAHAATCTTHWRSWAFSPPQPQPRGICGTSSPDAPGRRCRRSPARREPLQARPLGFHPEQFPPATTPARGRKVRTVKVGIPREVKDNEFRVAITPSGVHELVTRA